MRISWVRHALEAILTFLLFTLQDILLAPGLAISTMFIPLFAYLVSLHVFYPYLENEINVLLFSKQFIVGRVIAVIGFFVLLLAMVQFVRGYVKRVGVVKTGLYSVVRHPQYAGITVMTVGLTIMVLTLKGNILEPIYPWFVQVLGYIVLACYEEWRLEKKYGEDYRQYKRHVPFMFLLKCPTKVPEVLFTILIAVIIAFILFLIPFNLVRFA